MAIADATDMQIMVIDTANGLQLPPVLHAICDRSDTDLGSREVRINGASPAHDVILLTSDRLCAFELSLNLTSTRWSSPARHHGPARSRPGHGP
jgi:hypothetical protein